MSAPTQTVTAFRIEIPSPPSTTCATRLARTRWPDELPGAGWDYGVPVDYLQGAGRVLARRLRLARAGGAR